MTALIGDVIIPLSHSFDLGPFILGCTLASILAFMLVAFNRSGLFDRTYSWQTASVQGLGEVSPLGDNHNRLSGHGRLSGDKVASEPMRCHVRR
jgi:hypothetical protein